MQQSTRSGPRALNLASPTTAALTQGRAWAHEGLGVRPKHARRQRRRPPAQLGQHAWDAVHDRAQSRCGGRRKAQAQAYAGGPHSSAGRAYTRARTLVGLLKVQPCAGAGRGGGACRGGWGAGGRQGAKNGLQGVTALGGGHNHTARMAAPAAILCLCEGPNEQGPGRCEVHVCSPLRGMHA